MRKGNFLANFTMLLSIAVMFLFYVYMYDMNIVTISSMVILGLVALFIIVASLSGINSITSITRSFSRVRRIIRKIYVEDSDAVWEVLSEQTFLFKNRLLDNDMSNYKREMERVAEEGLVYNQADIRDYINLNRIDAKVKRTYMESLHKIVGMVAIVGTMLVAYMSLGVFRNGIKGAIIETFFKPILVLNICIGILVLMYVAFYKSSYAKMEKEYVTFIGEFNRCVMPDAKNDMWNNVLYLQQANIQTVKKVVVDAMEDMTVSNKEFVIRHDENTKELDRHIESMVRALNRFNEGIDDLKLSIGDKTKNDTLIATNQVKTCKNMLDNFEDKVNRVMENVEKAVIDTKTTDEVLDVNVDVIADGLANSSAEILVGDATEVENEKIEDIKVEEKLLEENSEKIEDNIVGVVEEAPEEVKKIKKATTRKTATKKATTKKTTIKKTTKKEEKSVDNEVKDVNVDAIKKLAEVAVELPAKKKRGRKSKAEKEAELQAALAKAALDAEKLEKASELEKVAVEEVKEERAVVEEKASEEEKVEEPVAEEKASEEEKVEELVAEEKASEEEKVEEPVVEEKALEEEKVEEPVAEEKALEEEKVEELVAEEKASEEEKVEEKASEEEKVEELVAKEKVSEEINEGEQNKESILDLVRVPFEEI